MGQETGLHEGYEIPLPELKIAHQANINRSVGYVFVAPLG